VVIAAVSAALVLGCESATVVPSGATEFTSRWKG
jgi:hypothetical protein